MLLIEDHCLEKMEITFVHVTLISYLYMEGHHLQNLPPKINLRTSLSRNKYDFPGNDFYLVEYFSYMHAFIILNEPSKARRWFTFNRVDTMQVIFYI